MAYDINQSQIPGMSRRPGPLGQLGTLAKSKALSAATNAMFPGSGLLAQAAQSVIPSMFNKGGNVQRPAYVAMGGLTPGPLGMSDMLKAGKGKDVSKVVYKKKGGDIEDSVEIAYHAPLAAKPQGG